MSSVVAKKKMNEPSVEQKKASEFIRFSNVLINCVAGSGKTTTVLHTANSNKDKKILLLTYNKILQLETKSKAESMEVDNLDIYTYHGFANTYYKNTCVDNFTLVKLLENPKLKTEYDYDIIVCDEVQDMTPILYQLVILINKHNKTSNNWMILGDPRQCIYEYDNASPYFVLCANKIFPSELEWISIEMKSSYRITPMMSEFINKCLYGSNIINSNKSANTKVKYICASEKSKDKDTNVVKLIYNEIKRVKRNKNYTNDDILILAPSTKSKFGVLSRLQKYLTAANFDIYVNNFEDSSIDREEKMKNKICFLTFHQAKGLERKVVFVINFDKTYFDYYARNADPSVCPNTIYVACTRAKEHLVVVHISGANSDNKFEFVDVTHLNETCEVIGMIDSKSSEKKVSNRKEYTVTDLTKHLNYNDVLICKKMYESKSFGKCGDYICLNKNDTVRGEIYSDIVGLAIPNLYEIYIKNKSTILDLYNSLDHRSKDCSKNRKFCGRCFYEKCLSDIHKLSGNFSTVNLGNSIIEYDDIETDNKDGLITIDELADDFDDLTLSCDNAEYDQFSDSKEYNEDNEDKEDKEDKEDLKFRFEQGDDIPMLVKHCDITNKHHLDINTITINDMIALSNIDSSLNSTFTHRLHQIKDYNLISVDSVKECFKKLDKLKISENARFEVNISSEIVVDDKKYRINGRIDCIDGNNIYEFKCSSNGLTIAHDIQLIVYMYLYKINYPDTFDDMHFFLFNIFSGELLEITCDDLEQFVRILIRCKIKDIDSIPPDVFIEKMSNIKNGIENAWNDTVLN